MTLNSQQFHEMSRSDFESLPGTMFHGTPSGVVGSGNAPIHVGTQRAALEALGSRMAMGNPSGNVSGGAAEERYNNAIKESRRPERSGKSNYSNGSPIVAPDPQIVGGRITGRMVNTPLSPYEDDQANSIASRYQSKNNMRQGLYYSNEAEDEGSVSAVLPRSSFKTHEDYLVEARSRGERIPPNALKGYSQIPGQQRLF